jgi:hypothetical protein
MSSRTVARHCLEDIALEDIALARFPRTSTLNSQFGYRQGA